MERKIISNKITHKITRLDFIKKGAICFTFVSPLSLFFCSSDKNEENTEQTNNQTDIDNADIDNTDIDNTDNQTDTNDQTDTDDQTDTGNQTDTDNQTDNTDNQTDNDPESTDDDTPVHNETLVNRFALPESKEFGIPLTGSNESALHSLNYEGVLEIPQTEAYTKNLKNTTDERTYAHGFLGLDQNYQLTLGTNNISLNIPNFHDNHGQGGAHSWGGSLSWDPEWDFNNAAGYFGVESYPLAVDGNQGNTLVLRMDTLKLGPRITLLFDTNSDGMGNENNVFFLPSALGDSAIETTNLIISSYGVPAEHIKIFQPFEQANGVKGLYADFPANMLGDSPQHKLDQARLFFYVDGKVVNEYGFNKIPTYREHHLLSAEVGNFWGAYSVKQ